MTIDDIANELAPKYLFGYNTVEDIKQEIWVYALYALKAIDIHGNKMYDVIDDKFKRSIINRLIALRFDWVKSHQTRDYSKEPWITWRYI